MLIDEAAAKLKFCPLGRGAIPIGSGKFAAGINTTPASPVTTCRGSGCMLWETQQIVNETKEIECAHLDDKAQQACENCKGAGKFTKHIPHAIGFCGAGFQGPLAAGISDLSKNLAELVEIARGNAKEPRA